MSPELQEFIKQVRQSPACLRWETQLTSHHRLDETVQVQNRKERWHILVLVISGSLPGHIAGEELSLEADQMMWIPPQVVNGFTWTPDLSYQACWFRLDPEPDLALAPRILKQAGSCRPVLEQISMELATPDSYSTECLGALFIELLCNMGRCREQVPQKSVLSSIQCQHLEYWFQQHLQEAVTPTMLGRQLGLGPDWFARIFKRTYGLSPRSWMLRMRMVTAAEFLRNPELNISQAAEAVGVASPSLFHRQFKQVHGLAPTHWRLQRLREQECAQEAHKNESGLSQA